MTWYFAAVQSEHDLQNPTSAEKIRLLGERLRLGPASEVLDVASGRGGPALVLAREFGCRITCVERSEEFHEAARARVAAAGLEELVELVLGDAQAYEPEPERYDAALCLGATFVWGGLADTVAALVPAVQRGGFVAIGEPYWRTWPLPEGYVPPEGFDFRTLAETVETVTAGGLAPTTLIASSEDDWDRYESLQWLVGEEWLHEHPDDPSARDIRAQLAADREHYLRWQRDLLGWAMIAARKR